MLKNECCEGKAFNPSYVLFAGAWWTLCYACQRSYTRTVDGLRFLERGTLTAIGTLS